MYLITNKILFKPTEVCSNLIFDITSNFEISFSEMTRVNCFHVMNFNGCTHLFVTLFSDAR